MSFADHYLRRHSVISKVISEPDKNLALVVVIPCFNEPNLLKTLNSLWGCSEVSRSVEVIIVINSSEDSSEDIVKKNKETYSLTKQWIANHYSQHFRFHLLFESDLPKKFAGAGLARKIGMDQALFRFNTINKPNGIIISFDADATCDSNFLKMIEEHYSKYPKTNGTSIYFEHPLDGKDFSNNVYKGITQYELYLRYYLHSLRYTSFPYAFYTIGSCFTVRANTYSKQGGMNKKKAGEDFYFLQKIIPLGNYYDITSTKVIPSPRPSDRVPFGTGNFIRQFTDEYEMLIYNFDAFKDLRLFFQKINQLFRAKENGYKEFLYKIPESLKDFLVETKFYNDLLEINANSSSLTSFRKRFFTKFDAFKILKFLNFSHNKFYKKMPILNAAKTLAKTINIANSFVGICEKELLLLFRDYDKNF